MLKHRIILLCFEILILCHWVSSQGCFDLLNQCAMIKQFRQCSSFQSVCRRTCGGCPTNSPTNTGGDCIDDPRSKCFLQLRYGQCIFPHVKKVCPKSCEVCGGSGGGGTPAPGWSQWSEWKRCSKECNGGTQSRSRTCSRPGQCFGSSVNSRACNQQTCNGGGCTDNPHYNCYQQKLSNQCKNLLIKRECASSCGVCRGTQLTVTGGGGHTPAWSRWSSWRMCSKECNGGTQSRSRTCSRPGQCPGSSMGSRSCNQQACNGGGCRDNPRSRCSDLRARGNCIHASVKRTCPVSCGTCGATWDTWTKWSQCNKPCGTGQQSRTRTCRVSERCVGDSQQSRECNKQRCKTGSWSACSVTCGHGIEKRLNALTGVYETRLCTRNGECATVSCPYGQEQRFKNPSQCCTKTSSFGNWCDRPTESIHQYSRRIIGGDDSTRGEFPWMAFFRALGYCGGAVISKKYILTAAHCVQSDSGRRVDQFTVDLGFVDRRNNYNKQTASVIRSIVHPEYQFPKNDIAILQLKNDLVYSNYVRPICLPKGERVPYDSTCIALGWGISVNGVTQPSNILQNVDVKVFDPDVCIHEYSTANPQYLRFLKTKPGVLCAGDLFDKKDSCSGDSGGPLACQRRGTCGWFVAGVVSFGPKKCAYKGIPAAYTSVVAYENWINSVTR